jgi:hypothetical protein
MVLDRGPYVGVTPPPHFPVLFPKERSYPRGFYSQCSYTTVPPTGLRSLSLHQRVSFPQRPSSPLICPHFGAFPMRNAPHDLVDLGVILRTSPTGSHPKSHTAWLPWLPTSRLGPKTLPPGFLSCVPLGFQNSASQHRGLSQKLGNPQGFLKRRNYPRLASPETTPRLGHPRG